MRAVVQRVSHARVTVDGRVVGEIGRGLLAFVGVGQEDGPSDARYIAGKIATLRVFEDPRASTGEGGGPEAVATTDEPPRRRLQSSVTDVAGGVLAVPQFTLYGDCRKGRRPSFDGAAPPSVAQALYEAVVRGLREAGLTVATGEFQAEMQVALVNDGPVTLLLDSQRSL